MIVLIYKINDFIDVYFLFQVEESYCEVNYHDQKFRRTLARDIWKNGQLFQPYVIFWVVGEKCVWLQNKERIDTHNNTVMML